jgi:AcrR family transcriptional regulator
VSRTTPGRADARRNEKSIFAAAEAGFASGEAPDMASIARAAGVGVGTLYRRFGSRAGLVAAIFEDQVDGLVEEAGRLASSSSPIAALELWLSEYLNVLMAKRAMIGDLRAVFGECPELVQSARERATDALTPLLAAAVEHGAVAPTVEAVDVLAVIDGMVSVSSSQDAARRLRLIMNGLRVLPPAE